MLAGDRASGKGPTRAAPFVAGEGRGEIGEDAEAADGGSIGAGEMVAAGALVAELVSAGAAPIGVETAGAASVERLPPTFSSA